MRPLRLLLPVLLLSLLSCRTAAPPLNGGPLPPASRVVVLSLDGAAAETLHRLWREGAFAEGGFRQFFEEGQVADKLVPVDPTLTAVNHISLATGFAPEATGIVSNLFHPSGAAFLEVESGFDAPIGTETLWEAARRQGKRVGSVTWPGADGKTERRKADWGLIYVEAELRPELVDLARSDWSPAEASDPRLQGLRSFAPILLATLAQRGIAIAALDRKDDTQAAYDTVVPLVPPPARTPLAPGDWGSIPCSGPPDEEGKSVASPACLLKVLSVAPDLAASRIYLNGVYANSGYPDAFAQSFAESGLFWPGPPDDARLSATWQGKPGIDLATWAEQSERFTGFFGAALRFAAARDDWDLLMGYIPTIDEAGHQLLLTDPRQPGFTPERRAEFAQARRRVWQAVDRELAAFLRVLDLRETRVVIVSDHGMLPIHTMADPNVLLRDRALLTVKDDQIAEAGTIAFSASSGGCAHIYVQPEAPDRARLLADLKELFSSWTLDDGARPVAQALLREEAGDLGLDHPNSGDLILFSASGYAFTAAGLRQGLASQPARALGMHGNRAGDGTAEPDLNGIYLALGAGLRKGNAGSLRSVEVAGRVADWLGIEAPRREPPTP